MKPRSFAEVMDKMRQEMHLHVLESLGLLDRLDSDQRHTLAALVRTATYQPGATVVELDAPAARFHVVKAGKADLVLSNGEVVPSITKGAAFGETALLLDETSCRYTETVRAAGDEVRRDTKQ